MSIPVNPNVAILKQAWSMLWTQGSKFYVPDVLAKGGTFGSTTIPPLQTLALKDMDSVPLYSSDTWGNVDISLTGITLSGIPQVNATAFTPSADASSVTGTLAFTLLDLKGSYEVVGSGLVGCAMDIARAQIPPGPMVAAGNAATPPSNVSLAAQYRDQLVQQGGNGVTLVSTYYDQNDTINTILAGNNAFTAAWPKAEPNPGLNTAYFMGVTNGAGQNPGDPNYLVGDLPYNTHAFYMQTILLGVAQQMANGSTDPENPYVSLQNAIVGFKGATMPHASAQTVDTVMTTVQNAPAAPLAALHAVPESDVARRAREMAERDFPMWHAQAQAQQAAQATQVTTYKSSGSFEFKFPMPTITFAGTVTVSGIAPQQTLTVQVTSLSAAVPSIDIVLLDGSDPTFTADAQSEINDAQWFQQNVGVKVNAALNDASLLNTVSTIFNQALLTLLPGTP